MNQYFQKNVPLNTTKIIYYCRNCKKNCDCIYIEQNTNNQNTNNQNTNNQQNYNQNYNNQNIYNDQNNYNNQNRNINKYYQSKNNTNDITENYEKTEHPCDSYIKHINRCTICKNKLEIYYSKKFNYLNNQNKKHKINNNLRYYNKIFDEKYNLPQNKLNIKTLMEKYTKGDVREISIIILSSILIILILDVLLKLIKKL